MKIHMVKDIEHWRENSAIQSIIDDAEIATGYEAESYSSYDYIILALRDRVAEEIESAGHEVVWAYQQTRWRGCILLDDGLEQDAIYSAAVDACREEFARECVAHCLEMEAQEPES